MHKDFHNISPEDAMRIANTPAGQQLIDMLKKTDNNLIQDAVKQASAGNMEQMKKTLAPLLASQEIQKLLRQLGGK